MLNKGIILIVDDDKDDQLFLIDSIPELYPAFQCDVADNGFEALEYITKNPPPAYIFLDLNMPFVNELEFLRDFKKDKNNYSTAVIIYSTSSHPKDREITKNLGAKDYITKMSDAEKLKLILKSVFDNN